MAIPWYPKTQSSLLIEPSGNVFEKKLDQKFNLKKMVFKAWGQVLQLLIALILVVINYNGDVRYSSETSY